MAQAIGKAPRRTSADDVFEYLYTQINTLRLLPGTRLSEVEVAKQFDVSRQPVREAFIRLANRGLLLVRPQKATVVRQFSSANIKRARFARLAIETEILRRACTVIEDTHIAELEQAIAAQKDASAAGDVDRFHTLDYAFHKLICVASNCEFMFDSIADDKAQVDRLCLLSLTESSTLPDLIGDHESIVAALKTRDEDAAMKAIRLHLSRLDEVIANIRRSHAEYFED